MGLASELKVLVDELDCVHKGPTPWQNDAGIPDFVTAENGLQRFFTRNSKAILGRLSKVLYENRSGELIKIEIVEYEKIARQAIADMHAANEFSGFEESDEGNVILKLKALIEERLISVAPKYTHYFPAWTLGMERDAPFSLGPVTFQNRSDWIDVVDFPEQAKERYLNQRHANVRWKEILREALQKPNNGTPLEGLANTIYPAVAECPVLLKVTITGYEKNFSGRLAKLIAKTALDAMSLGFGASECFQQQALHGERLPPVRTNSLLETNGLLWLPGASLGQRVPSMQINRVKEALVEFEELFVAFGKILNGLVDPLTHAYPKLCNRWATALDWFGEGCRESSDSIALAKLGTCLDVLSCGGKNVGIKDMVVHLTGTNENTQVLSGSNPRTLKQLIKDIYDSGRSKILHGTHYDRLESFAAERKQAAYLARLVLIETALRLQNYNGSGDEKAFRTI